MPDPVAHGGPTDVLVTESPAVKAATRVGRVAKGSVALLPVLSKPFDLETLDRTIKGAGGVQPRG